MSSKALLALPGKFPLAGPEKGKVPRTGVARLVDPYGSVRYLALDKGKPIAALQVMTRDGRSATIANVYVLATRRREGLAQGLLELARRDFEEVLHNADLTEDGRAWRAAVNPGGPTLQPFPKGLSPERRELLRKLKPMTDEQLYGIESAVLDYAAFGFSRGDTMLIPVRRVKVQYPGDFANAVEEVAAWPKRWVGALAVPVEIRFQGGKWLLEDGHHRLVMARKLGKKTLLAEVSAGDNPIPAIRRLSRLV